MYVYQYKANKIRYLQGMAQFLTTIDKPKIHVEKLLCSNPAIH